MKMTRKGWFVPVLAAAAMCWGSTLAAQDNDAPQGNQTTLAKALLGARVSLGRGLAASASHGQAISAKFEMDDGKLQLSVYTLKDGKYFERSEERRVGKEWSPRGVRAQGSRKKKTERKTRSLEKY